MTLNSRQRRILRRRSPPRIVTIDGGKGILTPKHIVKPIDTKPLADPYKVDIESLNPILLEIISNFSNDSKISDSLIGNIGFRTRNIEYKNEVNDALGE